MGLNFYNIWYFLMDFYIYTFKILAISNFSSNVEYLNSLCLIFNIINVPAGKWPKMTPSLYLFKNVVFLSDKAYNNFKHVSGWLVQSFAVTILFGIKLGN